jgi:hypothetical protein
MAGDGLSAEQREANRVALMQGLFGKRAAA